MGPAGAGTPPAEPIFEEEFNDFLPEQAGTNVAGPEEFTDFLPLQPGTNVAGPEEFTDFT